jgi:tetrahydromethanopterin S-methyltransferase subunit H
VGNIRIFRSKVEICLFKFGKEQVVCDINGVKVGGEVGENPTVMIGSIFYRRDKAVQDEKTGTFNREKVEGVLSQVQEFSDKTVLPSMLDVVCTNVQNAQKYLTFVADATRMPILIDAVSQDAAIAGMECAKQLQILNRTILNSINPETKDAVYEKIKEVGLENSIALTYSSKALISYRERVKLLDTLIPKLEAAGIKKILVDTAVLDIPTLGLACKAIYEIKEKFGYPAGCGAHNAIESWGAINRMNDKILTVGCSAVVNSLPIAVGGDFVFYGPANVAKYMFPMVSIVDAAYGQIRIEEGKRPGPNHPRFKVPRFQ